MSHGISPRPGMGRRSRIQILRIGRRRLSTLNPDNGLRAASLPSISNTDTADRAGNTDQSVRLGISGIHVIEVQRRIQIIGDGG